MAVKHVTLRAWSDNSDVAPVKINQGDILSRTVVLTLLDSGGTPIDLTLSTVRVHFSKPDGKISYLSASIVSATAGIASVTLDSQCTAVPGTMKSIVQVTGPNGENQYIIGPAFAVGAINVEGSIISANKFTALTDALAQVQGIANKADKSTEINGHTLAESFNLKAADFSDVADLNADGKVIQDPASYGKADGGAVLPHTLPTTAKLVQLLNGVLVPIDLPAEGTLLEVGPNNTLVSASASARLIDAVSHDENEGYSHANVYRVGEMCFLSGSVSHIGADYTPPNSVIMKLPTGFWPQMPCPIFPIFGSTPIRLDVQTNGDIVLKSTLTADGWISLNGLSYNLNN